MATYVISDLHGQYKAFLKMLQKINFTDNDELYILGDIIDRGNQNLEIYDYIKDRENIHMLMGNHEKMFLDFASAVGGKVTDDEAVHNSYRAGRALELCFHNGGQTTRMQLEEKDQDYIDAFIRYLRMLPYFDKIEVNGRKFLLCHAMPIFYEGMDFQKALTTNIMDEGIIWNREFFDQNVPDDYTVIHGHTPAKAIFSYCNGKAYNIDCGCARALRLAAIRLDDMQEYYVKC